MPKGSLHQKVYPDVGVSFSFKFLKGGQAAVTPDELVYQKRQEIISIFAEYGDIRVRFPGSAEASDLGGSPDVDILVNLDKSRDQSFIICIRKLSSFVRKPFGQGAVRAEDSHDVCMDLISKLTIVLGCKVNVVDERALRNFYPITFSSIADE
jgi:predicted nucleotidyltransferase